MKHSSIFSYTSYREFLADWLKQNKYSYRTFVQEYQGYISLIALAKLLSRGRSGVRHKNNYRISPEALIRLGKAMRLNDADLQYLTLLRMENDADILKGPHGDAYRLVTKEIMHSIKKSMVERSQAESSINKADFQSKTAGLLAEFINILPNKFRLKILDEVLLQGRIYASRQSGKVGIKALQVLLRELNRMKDMGAP